MGPGRRADCGTSGLPRPPRPYRQLAGGVSQTQGLVGLERTWVAAPKRLDAGSTDYRGITQVDIEQRPDASGGYGIGWTRAGEWLVYTVVVQETGTYTVEFPVASNRKGGTFHLEFDGTDVTGPVDVPDTGSWQQLQTIKKESVRLRAGVHRMRLVMDTEGPSGSIGDIDFARFVGVE